MCPGSFVERFVEQPHVSCLHGEAPQRPYRRVPRQVPRCCIRWLRSLAGRRRQLKSPLYDTYDEAEVELTKLLNQVDEQRHPKSNILVSTLIDKWFEVAELEDSTRERYEGLNRMYIEPVFGSTQFAKLDPELLEKYYARLRKCKHRCDGRRSRNHVCVPLGASFDSLACQILIDTG